MTLKLYGSRLPRRFEALMRNARTRPSHAEAQRREGGPGRRSANGAKVTLARRSANGAKAARAMSARWMTAG
jgi:hypothetical protein